jgi:hypothetical protein
MREQISRVPSGDRCLCFRVQKYAIRADRKNARELMCDDDNCRPEAIAKFQDQIVEQT